MRRRGFTLIEVVIGLTMAVFLAATAMSFLVTIRKHAVEASVRAQMNRDGQVLLDLFEHDLVYFGAGVPFGLGPSGQDLIPAARRSHTHALAFVGDLPYPNTEVNGVMMVGGVTVGALSASVTSELSGACRPPGAAAAANRLCDTRRYNSLGLPVVGSGCSTSALGARTCPWGMRKWQRDNNSRVGVTLIRPDGTFDNYEHSADFSSLGAGRIVDVSDTAHLDLSAGAPFVGADSGVGSAFTHLDRVFWAIEQDGAAAGTECTTTCALFRRQCWAPGGLPDNAGFPSFANAYYGIDQNPSGCVVNTPTDGTNWEKVASGISAAQFFYFWGGSWQGAATTANDADDIRGIALEVTFRRTAPHGQVFTQTYRRQVMLDNRDTP